MPTLKKLREELAKHTLTEYLQSLSDEDLNICYVLIAATDIVGDKVDIWDAILQELDYRGSYLVQKDSNEESSGKKGR